MFSLVSPGVHPGAVLLPAPVRAPGDDPRQQPDPGPRHQVPVLNGQRAPRVALTHDISNSIFQSWIMRSRRIRRTEKLALAKNDVSYLNPVLFLSLMGNRVLHWNKHEKDRVKLR